MRRQYKPLHICKAITFGHLISSFTASHVDNNIAIGELGDGLGNHRLSSTESPWNGGRAALYAAVNSTIR